MSLKDRKNEVITRFCNDVAHDEIKRLAKQINQIPADDSEKTTILLTIIQQMLTLALNIFFVDETPEARLAAKLDFLKVIKRNWVLEAGLDKLDPDNQREKDQ